MQWPAKLRQWLRFPGRVQTTTAPFKRGRVDHVIILDGTMSTLEPGQETNAGLAYRLLCEVAAGHAQMSIRYEQGVQWRTWRDAVAVAEGHGIDDQISRAYGFIASRFRPGDRIFLLGYSRGAYAVRSLAGVIDMVGLLRRECATERNIRQVYRHYQHDPCSPVARRFARDHCHEQVEIEMVGVWDTVKALGNRLPVMWRFSERRYEFHNASLGNSIRHGFHALALNETREAYAPVMWKSRAGWSGVLEQVWFRGAHADIGGQLGGFEAARPLSNIPFVWMMEKLTGCGIHLPAGWKERFVQDVNAPSVGTFSGWGKLFLFRKKRVVGRDPSESIHPSVPGYETMLAPRPSGVSEPGLRPPSPVPSTAPAQVHEQHRG